MAGVVSPMLRRLAADRATGALVRDHGTLYLVDGQVVHAESPVAPGLDILLAGGSDRRSAGPGHGGRIGDGEREICRLGALFDAAFFALAPGRGPARFRYGHHPRYAGPGRPVPAAAVERETLRRRELLDSVWPYPALDAAPVVPRPAAPGQTVTARGRALLARADGVRTPAQLAWVLGRPAFHTLLEIRRLAAAGLVETPDPVPPSAPTGDTTAPQPTGSPAHRPTGLPDGPPGLPGGLPTGLPAALPGRLPPGFPAHRPAAPPAPEHAPPSSPTTATDPPDIALLRRVRDALEARL
ncbi:transcriptional regulator [Streptomyces kanasensis]|uniref:transcriptional regulator n=1 Tax=Streptomyces kanasensis TaxID=936756 RepID=UPI0036F4F327